MGSSCPACKARLNPNGLCPNCGFDIEVCDYCDDDCVECIARVLETKGEVDVTN